MKNSLRQVALLIVVLQLFVALPASAHSTSLNTPQQTDTAEPQSVIVKVVRNANLRGGPGTNYAIVGGIKSGQSLSLVAQNAAGDWYKTADGKWIFAQLLESRPVLPVDADVLAVASAPAPQPAAAQTTAAPTSHWVLVADSAADFPGGRDKNNWYYLWSDGRNNFHWQDMRLDDATQCYKDYADKKLEICRDTINANTKGDVAVQWKANKGGTYRFEWDASVLKFYKHTSLVGISETGTSLPYATTIENVIEWELFFWVPTDSTSYHIRIYRLEEGAAQSAAAEGSDPASIVPTAANAPTATPTQSSALTFGSGMKIVGTDIAPGTYRAAQKGGNCYWERLRAFDGTVGAIIGNDAGPGPWIVTILAGDRGFYSARCGTWTLDLSPITTNPTNPFGDGSYFVGKDIAPGTWQSNGSESCYWERLSGFSGRLADIEANAYVIGPTVVGIHPNDTGFRSQRCGTWTRIGD